MPNGKKTEYTKYNNMKYKKWDAMNNDMGQSILPGILLQKQIDNSFSKRNVGENTRKV